LKYFYIFFRYIEFRLEFVHLSLAEVAKHSIGIAQRNIILNDVRFLKKVQA